MENENTPSQLAEPSKQTNDTNMDKIYQEVLKKKTLAFIQTSQLTPFYEYCDNLKDKLIDEERYLEARDADLLMKSIIEELSYRKDYNPQPATPKNEEQENQNAKAVKKEEDNMNQLIQRIDKKIQEQEESSKQKIQALQQKQMDELKKFETEWSDVMPEKYRRPSKRLILLKEQAHTLAVAGKYQEANLRQIEAKNLMQEEFETAKMKLNRDYHDAKKNFVKKQNEELDILQTTQKQQHDLLLIKKQELQESISKRKSVLDQKSKTKSTPNNTQNQSNANHLLYTSRNSSIKKASNYQLDQFKLPPLTAPNKPSNLNTTRKNQKGTTARKTNATTEQPTPNTTARTEEQPEEQPEENATAPIAIEEEEEQKEQQIEGGTTDE